LSIYFLTETVRVHRAVKRRGMASFRKQKEVLVQDSSAAQTDDKISNWMAGIAMYLPWVCVVRVVCLHDGAVCVPLGVLPEFMPH